MSGNKSSGTAPERTLRQALWQAGLRGYRKNVKRYPGSPDVLFIRRKLAIFVHGCFWHGCPHCKRNLTPVANAEFWAEKLRRNRERDQAAEESLRSFGFAILVLWECQIKKEHDEVIKRIRESFPVISSATPRRVSAKEDSAPQPKCHQGTPLEGAAE
jgi:DNA mismatch endonuclease, patch repair protein